MKIHAFIQARMNSSRFPGKVLAMLNEQPVIYHVISRLKLVKDIDRIIILTSKASSDDPLAAYLEKHNFCFFRGSLDNVFERFQDCLKTNPCDYFFRVCGDSPFSPYELLNMAVKIVNESDKAPDLVTNVLPRTFPVGMSVELLKSAVFLGIEEEQLSSGEKEEITKRYYNTQGKFKIVRIISADPSLRENSIAIDRLSDLERLENTGQAEFNEYSRKMKPVKVCHE